MDDPIVIEPYYLALVAGLAFASSIIGGISGFGAGLVVAPFLLPIVGIKGVVPVIAFAMIIGNLARFWAFRRDLSLRTALRLLLPLLPGVAIGASLYDALPARVVAVFIGIVLIAAVPLRRYLQRRRVTPSPAATVGIAFGTGVLSGNAPGGGVLVVTLLLGLGLSGSALIGTDALIGTIISLTNSALFGAFGLLDLQRAGVGLLIGTAMIPGAFAARALVKRLTADTHVRIIEAFVLFGGLSFFWAAWRG